MWVYKIILLAALCVIKQTNCAPKVSESTEPWMEEEIEAWAIKGNQSERFNATLESLVFEDGLQSSNLRGERGISTCTLCRVTVKVFISLRRRGVSAETLRNRAIDLCILLKLYSPNVCRGIITLNTPIFNHIVMNKSDLKPKSVCGLMLESETCPLDSEEFEWEVAIDQNPISPIEMENSNENIKVVQITDLHYDPNYEPYGHSVCGEPMCCRKGQNVTNTSGKVAGYWGDYNWCDMPWHSVIDALDHVKNTHKNVSYVYYTGDIVDHGVWDTTKEGNIMSLNKSFHQIKKTFQDIPVYPILGNHEAQPMNVFAPMHVEDEMLSTKWLFSKIADLWISFGWLPESTRSTILHGGFYTISPKPGFRIIALNSNVCYRFNWWLLYNPQDPYGQLQWLSDTLLQAEKNREFVHILSHVPPGDKDCIYTWSREFRRIVKRFSHIISGQFNGHTHNDEIEVFFDPENNNEAYNIAWNAGSLTPFANLNPNYKVYTVNANNYMVKDYENWMYNLTLANELGPAKPPQWYKSYSFKKEYNLKDTSYGSIKDWVSLLSKNESMLRTYYRHFMTNADPAFAVPCGKTCLEKYACQIVVTENSRPSDCGV